MNCSVCGNDSIRSILDLGEIPLCDDIKDSRDKARQMTLYPMIVNECDSCKHCELSYKVDESLIYSGYLYKSSDSLTLQKHFKSYFEDVNAYFSHIKDKDLKCIDVGGNDGLFAKVFSEHGWEAHVLDPSPSINYCDESIIPHRGYLTKTLAEEIVNQTGYFDLLVSNNCIANIRDLHSFVESLAILLKPGGIVSIETGYLPEQLKNMAIEMVNHEHYHYFSVESMKQLLDQHGITLIASSVNVSKGGCIRFIGINDRDLKPHSLESHTEHSSKVADMAQICTETMGKVLKTKQAIKELVLDKKVVAFGACAGTTILTYIYELQDVYSKIYDDNEARHNKYMPGSGACISDAKDWYQNPGEICLNLAWRYGDMIRNKHLSFLPDDYLIIDIHHFH